MSTRREICYRFRMAPRLLVLGIALIIASCGRELDDSTPEGTAALFLDAMARLENSQIGAEERVYQLLDSESQERLRRRARDLGADGTRPYRPEEMLVRGRGRVYFQPKPGNGLRAIVEGDHATVTVVGAREGQRADLRLRKEEGVWRILLSIPETTGST